MIDYLQVRTADAVLASFTNIDAETTVRAEVSGTHIRLDVQPDGSVDVLLTTPDQCHLMHFDGKTQLFRGLKG